MVTWTRLNITSYLNCLSCSGVSPVSSVSVHGSSVVYKLSISPGFPLSVTDNFWILLANFCYDTWTRPVLRCTSSQVHWSVVLSYWGASLAWRRKNSRLSKRHASSKIRRWTKYKKEDNISLNIHLLKKIFLSNDSWILQPKIFGAFVNQVERM